METKSKSRASAATASSTSRPGACSSLERVNPKETTVAPIAVQTHRALRQGLAERQVAQVSERPGHIQDDGRPVRNRSRSSSPSKPTCKVDSRTYIPLA